MLGVSDKFSDLNSEAYTRFLNGIENADKFMGNAELTKNQRDGIYSAYTKMALWNGINKDKVKEAKKDSFSVLSGGKGKTDLLSELKEWCNKFIHQKTNTHTLNKESWFDRFLKNVSKAQYQAEMARTYATKDLQIDIHRKIWKSGSVLYLRKTKGYFTSAWLLEHSLQDKPSDVWRGNDSRIAYLINNDSNYLSALDDLINNSTNGIISGKLKGVVFNKGDLYYSIHKSDINVEGYQRSDKSWIVHSVLKDKYDFTEVQSFMKDEKNISFNAGIGTLANDAAVMSQLLNAITPYNITVDFYTVR